MRRSLSRTQTKAVELGAALLMLLAVCLGAGTAVAAVTTEQAATALLTPTAVPRSTVRCGGEYHNFPRTMDGFARWAPLQGAARYGVQIDCFDCRQVGKWDSEVGAPFQIDGINGTSVPSTFQFWGDNKGRWRARGEFGSVPPAPRPQPLRAGAWGPWCEFSFKTGGAPAEEPLGRPTATMRPACGTEFHNFPRVISMHWTAVDGAQFYQTEIDCLHCTQVGKWDSEVGTSYIQLVGPPAATSATNASHPFPGDNQGRWRVRAGRTVGRERAWGRWSEWCNFSFKTQPTQPGPAAGGPTARIVTVECAGGLTVKVHVVIDSPAGISSYSVWSTEAGGVPVDRIFVAPLPTHIDQVVTASHSVPDKVDRNHQWGLKVAVPGTATPIFTYGWEPRGADGRQRCPGHYQPLPQNPVPLS